MGLLRAVVLGLVQGITEFLPISSTAHLRITPELFGWQDPGAAFDAIIQLGTVAAVLVYFRRDIVQLLRAWVDGIAAAGAARHHRVASGLVRPGGHAAGGGARLRVQARDRDQPALALRRGRVDDRPGPAARRRRVDRAPRAAPRRHDLDGTGGSSASGRRWRSSRARAAPAPPSPAACGGGSGARMRPATRSCSPSPPPPPPGLFELRHLRHASTPFTGAELVVAAVVAFGLGDARHRGPAPVPAHAHHAGVRGVPAAARRAAARASARRAAPSGCRAGRRRGPRATLPAPPARESVPP